MPPGQRLVWFYRSPISIVAEALGGCTPGNLQVELDVWLGRNRAALNLRRQFGRDLLLINADEATLAELRTELAGVVVPSAGRRGPAVEGDSSCGVESIVAHLFAWVYARSSAVFGLLEATSLQPDHGAKGL